MLVLAIRTDKPEAEIYLYDGETQVAEYKWQAHRKLADTLHGETEKILKSAGKTFLDINKLAIYQGPGSFTGLRIGFSVVNALGYSFDIPVVACQGESWLDDCLGQTTNNSFRLAHPIYGSEPNITKPRK